jgi:hypothetical protein
VASIATLKRLAQFVVEGNEIAKKYEDTDDVKSLEAAYPKWEKAVEAYLSSSADPSLSAQFVSARGDGRHMLIAHNMDGDGWYDLMQGKIAALNACIEDMRRKS